MGYDLFDLRDVRVDGDEGVSRVMGTICEESLI